MWGRHVICIGSVSAPQVPHSHSHSIVQERSTAYKYKYKIPYIPGSWFNGKPVARRTGSIRFVACVNSAPSCRSLFSYTSSCVAFAKPAFLQHDMSQSKHNSDIVTQGGTASHPDIISQEVTNAKSTFHYFAERNKHPCIPETAHTPATQSAPHPELKLCGTTMTSTLSKSRRFLAFW